ncbi:MAG TPA: nuclear transport factor 2 family protein, partial [Acidobacteriaceae bacterium]
FMHGYKNSPTTTFVGKTIGHGYAQILARYQKTYAGKEKMGRLSFSDLEVNLLDAHFATVTGRYHLARAADGGGNAEGIFSLIFEKTNDGWKIILDHTS